MGTGPEKANIQKKSVCTQKTRLYKILLHRTLRPFLEIENYFMQFLI